MVQFISYISLYIENSVKGNGFYFKGSKSSIFCLASLLSRGPLLKIRICSFRSKFFPLKVDPILEELCSSHKQTGSHKSYFPLKTTVETIQRCTLIPLKVCSSLIQVSILFSALLLNIHSSIVGWV